MTKSTHKAMVKVFLIVEFVDDGENDLKDQAFDAAPTLPDMIDVEVLNIEEIKDE